MDQILQDSFGRIGPTPSPTLSTSLDCGREGTLLYAVVVLKARNVPLNKLPNNDTRKQDCQKMTREKDACWGTN